MEKINPSNISIAEELTSEAIVTIRCLSSIPALLEQLLTDVQEQQKKELEER